AGRGAQRADPDPAPRGAARLGRPDRGVRRAGQPGDVPGGRGRHGAARGRPRGQLPLRRRAGRAGRTGRRAGGREQPARCGDPGVLGDPHRDRLQHRPDPAARLRPAPAGPAAGRQARRAGPVDGRHQPGRAGRLPRRGPGGGPVGRHRHRGLVGRRAADRAERLGQPALRAAGLGRGRRRARHPQPVRRGRDLRRRRVRPGGRVGHRGRGRLGRGLAAGHHAGRAGAGRVGVAVLPRRARAGRRVHRAGGGRRGAGRPAPGHHGL
ncbi:MAG: hypothetical protein AVDCRST_MAG41-3254, partial [uncultured Corynebacteriales bacterium]